VVNRDWRRLVEEQGSMTGAWVDVDWSAYPLLDPDLLVRPREISRGEARRRHRERMRLLPGRLDALERLTEAHGVVLGSRGARECALLEDWVYDIAMAHGTELGNVDSPLRSLIHDTGMLCGDELIAMHPTLSWRLETGSLRNLHYHYTLLGGYTRAARGYTGELVFSYFTQLEAEFFGQPRRARWVKMSQNARELA
jgi:hypothetical protein